MVPGALLTNDERACCRMMQDQCGQMEMPASHGCCHKSPPAVYEKALAAKAEAQHFVSTVVIWLTPFESLSADSSVIGWVDHHDYSPPQLPPSTISILRI
jgi:hypothetical protein